MTTQGRIRGRMPIVLPFSVTGRSHLGNTGLDEMSRAGIFGDALVEGALAPIDAVVDLVRE